MMTIEEVGRFTTGNRTMVLVRTKGGASVLDYAEYKKLLRMYNRQKKTLGGN